MGRSAAHDGATSTTALVPRSIATAHPQRHNAQAASSKSSQGMIDARFRQAEVRDADVAVSLNQYVLRLEISV